MSIDEAIIPPARSSWAFSEECKVAPSDELSHDAADTTKFNALQSRT